MTKTQAVAQMTMARERVAVLEAEVVRLEGQLEATQEDAVRAWGRVARLEGLILAWDEGWLADPLTNPGKVKQGDEALMIEARRIRAQREEGR